MTRILVTGAGGFVGRALIADLAARGHQVRTASRRAPAKAGAAEWMALPDLSGAVDWTPLMRGIDAVVHAAAIAHTDGIDDEAYDRVNHRAVATLAEAARGQVERVVFISSIRAQSGPSAMGVLTEADPPAPTDAYGRSKLAAEAALAASGTPYVILRPVLVAGPDPSGNLATLLRLARLPMPLPLGALTAPRSLVARADLCAAIAHVLGEAAHIGQTYIVAHPEPIGITAMVAALRQGLGRAPGLLPVPAGLLQGLFVLTGRGAMAARIAERLVVSPAKLMARGWTPAVAPARVLAEIAAATRAGPGA